MHWGARVRGSLIHYLTNRDTFWSSVAQFRKNAKDMVDWICDYYASNEKLPVRSEVEPGYLRPLLPKAASQSPENFSAIMQDFQAKIMPGEHQQPWLVLQGTLKRGFYHQALTGTALGHNRGPSLCLAPHADTSSTS